MAGETKATKLKGGSKGNLISGDNVEQDVNKQVFKDVEELVQAQHADRPSLPNYVASHPGFSEELHKLKCQYQAKYQSLYDKWADIVNAKVEPTDEDCEWPQDTEDPLSEKFQGLRMKEKEQWKKLGDDPFDESVKGQPDFWTEVFKNSDIRSIFHHRDLSILKHLQDVQLFVDENKSFRLDFVFEENEFFTNKVISKTYYAKIQPEEDNPIRFKCKGTYIHWKKGKDVTVRQIKKVHKHKFRRSKTVLTKTLLNNSFFNFFSPPIVLDDMEMDEDTKILLEADIAIGQYMREHIIPQAVLYYTEEDADYLEEEDDKEQDEN